MGILAAWSGGSLWPSQHLPKWLTWLPEALFACVFGYTIYNATGDWLDLQFVQGYILDGKNYFIHVNDEYIWGALAAAWSYGWMQAATANGLHWGTGTYKPDRDTSFSPIVNFITDKLNIDRSSAWYCRIYMGVKGFLITLPVGGLGFILWPAGYDVGNRLKNHTVSELASGFGAGINVSLFLYITG